MFHENRLYKHKIQLAVEKKNTFKLLGKIFVVALKKASHTISIYGNCILAFFDMKFSFLYETPTFRPKQVTSSLKIH